VLNGLSHEAIAVALQVLAVAQSFAIKHGKQFDPIPARIEMRWLASAARLDLPVVMRALNELVRPLPDDWPAILSDLTTRPNQIRCTVHKRFALPAYHIRVPLPVPTDTRGAVVLVLLMAEAPVLAFPRQPASRLPFKARAATIDVVNGYLRRAGRHRERLAQYDIHPPRAVRSVMREPLVGPPRVLGVQLEW
jgi:hypothetical protein